MKYLKYAGFCAAGFLLEAATGAALAFLVFYIAGLIKLYIILGAALNSMITTGSGAYFIHKERAA